MNQEILHDSYDYAIGGQLDGCWLKYPGKKNKAKREECHAKAEKDKGSSAETDRMLAQAVLNKSTQAPDQGLSAMAITGIIVGSLLAITLMVVVIKKVKTKK
jgi:hypothetical protein